MIQIDLDQKVILVTGASDGIGKAIAGFLMKMGATVAVHYNTNRSAAEALVSSYNTNSKAFQADLANENEVISLFETVESTFGSIDVVILNAGVFQAHSTNLDTEEWWSIWKKTIDINLHAVGLLTKLGIDHFKKNGEGRFIFIGSRAVFRGETEEFLGYAASKGGLVSLARSVARSFGKDNIKSFVLSPGFTKTRMAEDFIKIYGEEKILNEISLNELTTPEDLTALVGLMCSGLMDHATGATIDVNAGSHIR